MMVVQRRDIPYMVQYRRKPNARLWMKHNHVEGFNNLVKYLVRLRRDGEIDNDTFADLIRQATSAFVQTEIAERVDQFLEGKISIDLLIESL